MWNKIIDAKKVCSGQFVVAMKLANWVHGWKSMLSCDTSCRTRSLAIKLRHGNVKPPNPIIKFMLSTSLECHHVKAKPRISS